MTFDVKRGHKAAPLLELHRDIEPSLAFFAQILPPAREDVGPGFNGIDIAADLRRREACGPPVVVAREHARTPPFLVALMAPKQVCREHRVALAEDVGPDIDWLVHDPLHRKAAAINEWIDVFNENSPPGAVADRGDCQFRCHGLTVPLASLRRVRRRAGRPRWNPLIRLWFRMPLRSCRCRDKRSWTCLNMLDNAWGRSHSAACLPLQPASVRQWSTSLSARLRPEWRPNTGTLSARCAISSLKFCHASLTRSPPIRLQATASCRAPASCEAKPLQKSA